MKAPCTLPLLMRCPLWTRDGLSGGDSTRLQSPWPAKTAGRSHSVAAPVGPEGVSNCISQALNKTRPCSSWSWSSCWDVAVICDSSAGCGSSACQCRWEKQFQLPSSDCTHWEADWQMNMRVAATPSISPRRAFDLWDWRQMCGLKLKN